MKFSGKILIMIIPVESEEENELYIIPVESEEENELYTGFTDYIVEKSRHVTIHPEHATFV